MWLVAEALTGTKRRLIFLPGLLNDPHHPVLGSNLSLLHRFICFLCADCLCLRGLAVWREVAFIFE